MAKIGYLGHSCFTLEIGGTKLLIDPFITPNPLASSVDLKSIEADYILVSHGHQDHTADLITLAQQTHANVVAIFEVVNWVNNQGYTNITAMNIGGTLKLNGLNIKMVNAIHSSSFADGSYAGNPAGFVIWDDQYCVYYAGDTALSMDMKLIAGEFKIDMAFLPIGDVFTMGVDDAAKAAEFCGAKRVIGMHYDTFPMIKLNVEKAQNHFKSKGVELLLMPIGTQQNFNR